jgi:hypothetical protein
VDWIQYFGPEFWFLTPVKGQGVKTRGHRLKVLVHLSYAKSGDILLPGTFGASKRAASALEHGLDLTLLAEGGLNENP